MFTSPKSYALRLKNGKAIIKIKGYNDDNIINFKEFKELFYSDKNFKSKCLTFLKRNFRIYIDDIDKEISLTTYDKRKWTKGKKETKLLWL